MFRLQRHFSPVTVSLAHHLPNRLKNGYCSTSSLQALSFRRQSHMMFSGDRSGRVCVWNMPLTEILQDQGYSLFCFRYESLRFANCISISISGLQLKSRYFRFVGFQQSDAYPLLVLGERAFACGRLKKKSVSSMLSKSLRSEFTFYFHLSCQLTSKLSERFVQTLSGMCVCR